MQMRRFFVALIGFMPVTTFAQENMDAMMNEAPAKEPVTATFKGTRVINFESVETVGKNVLEFMIQHRFGNINGGVNSFFGLDNGADVRLGLGYSFNGKLEVGIGRTSFEKLVDGYLKYRLLRQMTNGGMPVSVTLYGASFCTTQSDPNASVNGFDKYHYPADRLSYCMQVIVARKFSEKLSFQLSPSLVHYNLVENITDKNNAIALGFAGRYKVTRRMAITAEYGLRYKSYTIQNYYNSLGIGCDIETGGHVFQMFLTNSNGIVEPQFLTHTTTSWKNGGIAFGFNISRAFNL